MKPRTLGWLLVVGLASCGGRSALPVLDSTDDDEAPIVVYSAAAPTARIFDAPTPGLAGTGLKVALYGDQGVKPESRRVLQLVLEERADALILLGDLAYDESSPRAWAAQLQEELGEDFPVFAVIGNHDRPGWAGEAGFERFLRERLARMSDAECVGEYGVKATCTFRGLSFVLSGVGTVEGDHEAYLDSALRSIDTPFRLCVWHKNQKDMQAGAKTDEVGWEAYRVCARHGVPIMTGHEHSYARTQLLTAVGDRAQSHGATGAHTDLELGPGRTFVVVSGLGGMSRRERTKDHEQDSWWSAIYARDAQLRNGSLQSTAPQIEDGAFFLVFGIEGDPNKAYGYFKTVDGVIHDEFTWRARSAGLP